jgi:hypothetical protein
LAVGWGILFLGFGLLIAQIVSWDLGYLLGRVALGYLLSCCCPVLFTELLLPWAFY